MSLVRVALVVVGMSALAACSKPVGDARPAGADPALPSPELDALLDGVPADAALVVTLGLREPPWSQLTGGWLVPMQQELRDQLERDLGAQLAELTGLDVRQARAAVLYLSAADVGGLLVAGIGGTLRGSTGEHAGAALRHFPEDGLVVGHRGDLLVVSWSEGELEATLDRLAVGTGGLAGELRARIDRARGGATLAAAADVARLSASFGAGSELPPSVGKLGFASARVGGDGLRVAVSGEDAGLDAVEARLGLLAMAARAQATAARDAAFDEIDRMTRTIAWYYGENLLRHIEPQREGGELVIELPFAADGMSPNAAMVGVVAAVAIPAFME